MKRCLEFSTGAYWIMLYVLLVVLIALLGAISWTLWGLLEASRAIHSTLRTTDREDLVGLLGTFEARLRGVEEIVDRLPTKWEDIKRESTSLYQRARHHVRRANEELAERGLADPELLDLDRQLHPVDAEGGGGSEVPPVREDVAPPPQGNGFDPGDWRHVTLRRKYGG